MKNKGIIRKNLDKADENKILMYTALGLVFGFMFPVNACSFELYRNLLELNLQNIAFIHEKNPVLYIIDIAPIFFGFFSFLAGSKQQEAFNLTKKQHSLLSMDYQTGLENKYSSKIKFENYEKMLKEDGSSIGIALISIKNLNKITSYMGVDFESQIIMTVAERLKTFSHILNDIFRIGQNEFMVVGVDDNLQEFLTKVSSHFQNPQKISNISCIIELNIGVAYSSNGITSPSDIMDNAYCAMESHKNLKQKNFIVYNLSMKNKINSMELESELFYAYQKKEFFLVYQPVVDVKTQEIKGYETLIRWKSPVLGNVSPALFIPLLERSNLINDVGMWILEEGCKTTKYFQEKYDPDLFVSINVSINQFFDVEFIRKLNEIVMSTGIRRETIRLEITESVSSEKRDYVRDIFYMLNTHGYRLSIDDFGTGYSSLHELDRMNLYSLKVDKSFVDKITPETPESPITEAIISMAKGLGLKVIVEGVENEFQFLRLRSLGCDYIQGYYFYKPLPITTMDKALYRQSYIRKKFMFS